MTSGNYLLAVSGGAIALGFITYMVRKGRKDAVAVDQTEEENIAKSKRIAAANENFTDHITDHDGNGLVNLSPDVLWHVKAKFKGNGPPWRRMIIYRPPGTRSLLILSPTAVPEDVMSEMEALGEPDVLIIPNTYHRTDAAVFKARYPKSKVASPPGWVKKGVNEVVEVDMDARELANRYDESVRVVQIGGLSEKGDGDFEFAYEFKCANGKWAYAVTDTLFNFTEKGFMNWVFGSRGILQPDGSCTPRVGRISKFLMHSTKDCAKFYREMAKREDICMILMAHGDITTTCIQNAFNSIADDLS